MSSEGYHLAEGSLKRNYDSLRKLNPNDPLIRRIKFDSKGHLILTPELNKKYGPQILHASHMDSELYDSVTVSNIDNAIQNAIRATQRKEVSSIVD